MKFLRQRILQGILMGLMLVVVGCKMPPKPMHFNNLIARGNDRLAEAAKKFYKAIEPLSKGAPADVSAAQSASSEMQAALQDLKKEFDAIRAPLNSPPGVEMLEKYREFLKTQQSIYETCITPMLGAVQDDRNADKWGVIAPLLTKATELEAPVKSALEKAQTEFAKYHILEAKTQ